jgi:serine/threonine-protein kinase RsbT
LRYATRGEIAVRLLEDGSRRGIAIIASDDGPGISNVVQALEDGFSTSGSLGLGLPGVRRLMDEFDIDSGIGRGTVVTAKKWKR